jgi:subtilisin family serine protease
MGRKFAWYRLVVVTPIVACDTSMASPHAAGVAALIRQVHAGMPQGAVAAKLRSSATPLACPTVWPAADPRQCTGGRGQTSFFGAGMVNALERVMNMGSGALLSLPPGARRSGPDGCSGAQALSERCE